MTDLIEYRAYGLCVRSEIELLGGRPIPDGSARPTDIEIRMVQGPEPIAATAGPYTLGEDGFTFTASSVAHYRCVGGRRIDITPARAAADADVAGMLIATALPALLWWRGDIVLHAAAFVLPGSDGAIAIGGRSGAGKSTMLARALKAGATIVGDDSIRVGSFPDSVLISGLPGAVLVQPTGATGLDRVAIAVPSGQQSDGARWKALVIVDQAPAAPAGLRRLEGIDAIERVLASRHRPRIATLSGRAPSLLPKLISLARRIPIYAQSGPRDAALADPQRLAACLDELLTS